MIKAPTKRLHIVFVAIIAATMAFPALVAASRPEGTVTIDSPQIPAGGSMLFAATDSVLVDHDFAIHGLLVIAPASQPGAAFTLSVRGMLTIDGAIFALPSSSIGSGSHAPDGTSVRVFADELRVLDKGTIRAADGSDGAQVVRNGADFTAHGQDAGRGGDVIISAQRVSVAGKTFAGHGGKGGNAFAGAGANSVGGNGGDGGRVIVNGEPKDGGAGGDGGSATSLGGTFLPNTPTVGVPVSDVIPAMPQDASPGGAPADKVCAILKPYLMPQTTSAPTGTKDVLLPPGEIVYTVLCTGSSGGGDPGGGGGGPPQPPCPDIRSCVPNSPSPPTPPSSPPPQQPPTPPTGPCASAVQCGPPPVNPTPPTTPTPPSPNPCPSGCPQPGPQPNPCGSVSCPNPQPPGGPPGQCTSNCGPQCDANAHSCDTGPTPDPCANGGCNPPPPPPPPSHDPCQAAGSCPGPGTILGIPPAIGGVDGIAGTVPCGYDSTGTDGSTGWGRSGGSGASANSGGCRGQDGTNGADGQSVPLNAPVFCTNGAPGGPGSSGHAAGNARGGNGGDAWITNDGSIHAGHGGAAMAVGGAGGNGGRGGNGGDSVILACTGGSGGNGGPGGQGGMAIGGNGGRVRAILVPLSQGCGGGGSANALGGSGGTGGAGGSPGGVAGTDGVGGSFGYNRPGSDCPAAG